MQISDGHINRIFLTLIGAACYLPKIYIFTDTLLLPKWYAFLLVLLLWILFNVVVAFRENWSNKDVDSFDYALFAILSMAVCECVYVIIHALLYGLSTAGEGGTFDNPSGLALCTAVPLAFSIGRLDKKKGLRSKLIAMLCVMLFISTIILSKSRTGVICITALILWQLVRTKRISGYLRYGVVCVFVMMTAAYVVLHKKDSTSGRYFILTYSFELICEHPIAGHGYDGFGKAYMLKQADFFRRNPDSKYSMLADEIHHPLNEFVDVWIKYGISGPVVLLSLFVVPAIIGYRSKDKQIAKILPSLLVIFIFCLFSYPLNYPLSWLVIGISIIMTAKHGAVYARVCELFNKRVGLVALFAIVCMSLANLLWNGYNEYRWNIAWHHLRKNKDTALDEYAAIEPHMSGNQYFLYNYAFALYSKGQFDESIAVMKECLNYWNGYNLQLLMGDACRMSGKNSEAIPHYNLAQNMCPARLAPLEGLYLIYDTLEDYASRKRIIQQISKQKIKVPSYDALRIKQIYR